MSFVPRLLLGFVFSITNCKKELPIIKYNDQETESILVEISASCSNIYTK